MVNYGNGDSWANYAFNSSSDNGTAGWFLENFRNMLVMEEGQSLWVARATPRVWLQDGKKDHRKKCTDLFRDIVL